MPFSTLEPVTNNQSALHARLQTFSLYSPKHSEDHVKSQQAPVMNKIFTYANAARRVIISLMCDLKCPLWCLGFALCALLSRGAASEGGTSGLNDKKIDEKKDEPVVWTQKVVPGPAIEIRLKRNLNKVLVYEGSLDRSQQAATSYSEQDKFIATIVCASKKNEVIKGQNKELDMLAIRRTFTERKRSETLESGRKLAPVLPNTEDLINLGPNFDVINQVHCYAFDNQNIMACRTEQVLTLKDQSQLHGKVIREDDDKVFFMSGDDSIDVPRADIVSNVVVAVPHICMNESPHYLFPMFSERKVAPGETWAFKVPVIMPVEQGVPPRVWPTQFYVRMVARLREVTQAAGTQLAIVDYQLAGRFDSKSDEFAARFPASFHQANRLVHKLSGEGMLVVDVDNGRIMQKNETFHFTLYGSSIVVQAPGKAAKEETHKAEISSHFEMKLVMPGTRLKNGAIIPPFE